MTIQEQYQALKRKYSADLEFADALDLSLQAAALTLQCLQNATHKEIKAELSKSAKLFLDEAERIKKSSPEHWRVDCQQSLISLESFEIASELAQVSCSKQTPKALPLGVQPISTVAKPVRALAPPISKRKLPSRERIILLKVSKLNGFKFPPWESAPDSNDFDMGESSVPFIDEPDLPLSDAQKGIMSGWRRPTDAITPLTPPQSNDSKISDGAKPTMRTLRKIDLVQDAATDCSVVASLCAGVARAERGHARLMSTMIYPYDKSLEQPIVSPNGKYVVRLTFNGCARKVVIDDRLPASKDSRMLHVIDRNNPSLLWPALLEKAYLKVRGGYDFLGSNSGTDLWVIAGWLPEQIFLQNNELDALELWQRIFKPFSAFGDVLITMGTGKLTEKAENDLGLAGEHDYAVLDLKESDGHKYFLIKNPWINGISWNGYQNREHRRPSQLSPPDVNGEGLVNSDGVSTRSQHNDEATTPGTFWMEIADVIQNFDSIYLNWNPGLFTHREDLHDDWDLSPTSGIGRCPPSSFSRNPQYSILNHQGGHTWILLSRHFTDKHSNSHVDSSSIDRGQKGYISLYAFDARGKRVLLSSGATKRGCFVDSPQTLLKLDLPPKVPYTIVFAEQDLDSSLHTFTISAWSRSPIELAAAENRFPQRNSAKGSWTHMSAGGNADSPKYGSNPQYLLTLGSQTTLSILLETLTEKRNVHIKLLHGQGQRIHSVRTRDIVKDSGDYRLGCALAEIATPLPAGRYTIIVSTFVADQLGDFTLQVDSNAVATLKPIAREGSGRIKHTPPTADFASGVHALAAPLRPRRLTRFNVTAHPTTKDTRAAPGLSSGANAGDGSGAQIVPRPWQVADNGATGISQHSTIALTHRFQQNPPSPILLTIEHGTGPNRAVLGSSGSGTFEDPTGGVRIGDVDLQPSMLQDADLWLILQRMGGYGGGQGDAGGIERYSVELWLEGLEGGLEIGEWRPVERDVM